jgi:hypothetical protein
MSLIELLVVYQDCLRCGFSRDRTDQLLINNHGVDSKVVHAIRNTFCEAGALVKADGTLWDGELTKGIGL